MNTTVRIKQSEVYKDWHIVDAAGRPLGRVATEVATLLKGKHKPTYERHLDDGDFVIVINASQVRVSGSKDQQITYYRHSGYPGGLKSRTYAQMMDKFPERVLEQAIWGMLPKGPLGRQMFRHLKVYKFANHPHKSQIASTQTAQAARLAAQAELATTERKVARLRPLSVPQIREDAGPTVKKVTAASAAARAAKSRVRGTAPAAAPAEAEEVLTPVAEAPAVEAPAAEAPAAEAPKRAPRRKAAETEAAAPAVEKAEAPKRAPRKKAAEASTEATTDEAPKPARRRAAAKSEGTEE